MQLEGYFVGETRGLLAPLAFLCCSVRARSEATVLLCSPEPYWVPNGSMHVLKFQKGFPDTYFRAAQACNLKLNGPFEVVAFGTVSLSGVWARDQLLLA